MNNLYLIARIDGQRVAISAHGVDSVVNVTQVTPAPLAPLHVRGLAALRSRVITMIDVRAALGLAAADPAPATLATAVVNVDGHQYGLIVDRVEDVRQIAGAPTPLRAPPGGAWARVALGLLEQDGALLLLDPGALIAVPECAAA